MSAKITKGFIGFISGVITTLVIIAIIVPLYCDYTERAIIYNWVRVSFPQTQLCKTIESKLLKKESIQATTFAMNDKNIVSGYVNQLGEVFAKTNVDGSVVLLKPKVVDNKVVWQCYGGSSDAMPNDCRKPFDVLP